jgi:hypothetical protein
MDLTEVVKNIEEMGMGEREQVGDIFCAEGKGDTTSVFKLYVPSRGKRDTSYD